MKVTINEPIPGQGGVWRSVGEKCSPLAVRVFPLGREARDSRIGPPNEAWQRVTYEPSGKTWVKAGHRGESKT